jgi:excisionase family DNA binding protein
MSRRISTKGWQNMLSVDLEVAAVILDIGRGTAYKAAKTGELPVLKFGRRQKVPVAALKRMLGMVEQKPAA